MLTLYGHPHSNNTRKVHFLLEELGAEYRYEHVDLWSGAHKKPEYLKLNPNGRLPILDDGGFILWESNAILWYVADSYGRGTLVPDDPKHRALIDQWMWWQYSDLSTACARPHFIKVMHPILGKPVDEAEHARLCEAAKRPLAVLDAHLDGRHFVVGERMSIADIALFESADLCEAGGIPLADYPHLRSWIGRLRDRPSYQKTRPPV